MGNPGRPGGAWVRGRRAAARGQHARSLRRPRRGGGVFLALAVALIIAAGVPIGMLAARTLAHHGDQRLKTAPLSASQTAGSARGAATFSALAGPGCPNVTSATVFPYHAPNGDGWHDGGRLRQRAVRQRVCLTATWPWSPATRASGMTITHGSSALG